MCACSMSVCVGLSPPLSDISLASALLWCQGDGKHARSGNYEGSKHFSWMISFCTAEKQAKEGGRQMCCKRGGEGCDERMSFSWDEKGEGGRGKKTAEEI